jgi:hypothetical protein
MMVQSGNKSREKHRTVWDALAGSRTGVSYTDDHVRRKRFALQDVGIVRGQVPVAQRSILPLRRPAASPA